MGVWHFSTFRKGVTRDSKNGLEAEVRGKDTRLFIHADAFVGKGYYAAAKTTKWGTYLNVPNDPRWTAYEKTGKLTVSFMVNSTIDPDSKTEEHHARIVSNKADFGDAKGFEIAIAGGERIWSCGQGRTNFWYDANKHGGMDKYSFRGDWAYVTVTYDAEADESAIYFNGRRVASAKGAAYAPTVTGRSVSSIPAAPTPSTSKSTDARSTGRCSSFCARNERRLDESRPKSFLPFLGMDLWYNTRHEEIFTIAVYRTGRSGGR